MCYFRFTAKFLVIPPIPYPLANPKPRHLEKEGASPLSIPQSARQKKGGSTPGPRRQRSAAASPVKELSREPNHVVHG